MAKIVILGGGFGSALAVVLHGIGHDVTLWSAFAEEIEAIRRDGEQKAKLPGVPIPQSIHLTTDLQALSECDLALFVIPSKFVRETVQKAAPYLAPNAVVCNAGKGVEDGTLKRMSILFAEEMPQNPYVVITGPCHAEEISRGIPTSLVTASANMDAAAYVQKLFAAPYIRTYLHDDVCGCELGGALKNIIALSAGISDGLGYGDNTKAALMTRGLHEITRLGVALGAKRETFSGLTGLGDLIVTCTSMHSRNRRAGILIGQGVSPEEAVRQVGTVEGYHSCHTAYALAKQEDVEMPITEQLYHILFEQGDVNVVSKTLFARPQRSEYESFP